MITIKKGSEPHEWTKKRATPGASFESIPELRDSLLKEQGYICAYCMCSVPNRNSSVGSKIEHIKPRSLYPPLAMDYGNMVICCPGETNGESHCDTKKANSEIRFSPFEPQTQKSISYSSRDGAIKSDNNDWNEDMDTVLNLNHSLLKANRKKTLEGVIEKLGKNTGKWKEATLEKLFQQWSKFDNSGKYNPYCGIVQWYLNKKLWFASP